MATYSRISRIEEKKTKKQLLIVMGITLAILFILLTLGIPTLVKTSLFVGNLKSKTPLTEGADKTPPITPNLSIPYTATNSAQLIVEGYAEPETILKIFVNGSQTKKVLLGEDGTFSFNDIHLTLGENDIYAIAEDASGNKSQPSAEFKVLYKNELPKLEISEPQEGQTFGKNDQEINIKGTTDAGNEVRINDRFVAVFPDGSFTFKIKLHDGENTLTIITRDSAGNETKLERKVTYSP